MQGWRNTMEDSHVCCTNLPNGVSVFGVFDGHGGNLQYLNKILLIGREVALLTKDIFI